MNMTDAQIKATAEGRCCKWCRAPMHRDERGRWVNSGGWEYCTTRRHEAGDYLVPERLDLKLRKDAQAVIGGFIWLGNNLHNIKDNPDLFREFYEAALEDARKVYNDLEPTAADYAEANK